MCVCESEHTCGDLNELLTIHLSQNAINYHGNMVG